MNESLLEKTCLGTAATMFHKSHSIETYGGLDGFGQYKHPMDSDMRIRRYKII